ncbi:MAG: adenylate cyclase, partial [Pseudomonadota bacterium]|nr:adenylate cyclase [Pseudomonadota bacterium]
RSLAELTAGAQALPAAMLEQIVDRADGVPLFVEEITRSAAEASGRAGGLDRAAPGATMRRAQAEIPSSLQTSLNARLDRLASAKEVAQVAAAIGREFPRALLADVTGYEPALLDRLLGALVDAQIVHHHPGGSADSFRFRHALIQDAAYATLLREGRRELHARIAVALETSFPERCATEPEVLAHHLAEAAQPSRAIDFLLRAARLAIERSANREALAHLARGLTLAALVPDPAEQARQEYWVQLTRYAPLVASESYSSPEIESTVARALHLAERLGTATGLFPVLYGRVSYAMVAGEPVRAQTMVASFFELAEQQDNEEAILIGTRMIGACAVVTGRTAEARLWLERAAALYDPDRHRALAYSYGQDSRTVTLGYLVLALWHQGEVEEAQRLDTVAMAEAEAMAHANTLGIAFTYAGALLHALLRRDEVVRCSAERLSRLGTEHRLPLWSAVGRYFQGWALAYRDDHPRGIADMHAGLEAMLALNVRLFRPIFLTWLAAAHGRNGEPEVGLGLLDEADTQARTGGESWLAPETLRVRGELLLLVTPDQAGAAARSFADAATLARRMGSRPLEARALAQAGLHRDARGVAAIAGAGTPAQT